LRRFTANWPEPPLLLLCRALRARGRGAAVGIGDGRLVALTAARDALPIPILLSDLVAVGIHPHCQLKAPWYALRVGGAAARVGELLCSPVVLPALKRSGRKKAPSVR